MTRYRIETTFDTTIMHAHLVEASAPISYETDDGEVVCTPYQTADARHYPEEAALLVYRYLGPEHWLSPDDERPEDEDDYIRDLILSVDPIDEAEDEE